MPDPVFTLHQIRQALVPGGFLLLEAPNQFDSLKSLMMRRLRSTLGERWIPLPKHTQNPEYHLYYFNVTSLRRLLGQHGFEILDLRTYIRAIAESW